MKPILQVALDVDDLFKALSLSTRIVAELGCGNIWMEAGTPLIKAWGRIGVDVLKKSTNCFVVADTKTMDTGAFEGEIVLSAGADAYTVLGLADDSTIRESIDKAHEYNKLLIVDLINHPNPYKRALELDRLGVDVVLYHVGIDVQRSRGLTIDQLIDEIKMLKKNINAKIAVAGGIKHGKAKPLVDAGADIVVVGSAITKADDPVESAKRFMEEILS
ncbi:Orotidine 5'-phosphate decarboxylase [Staphylothermus marinus F1]|uniref:Orotidine 5'-phosphate decarboxylase n=1 Tax=Staphylothermus marinus (strain ATCC 43588 / DSM 3639 / JCM 9404 / F1) TaxID=399550 RepID=A3DLU0_STAMF|nr:orotidine 5'-phosphate decarboxylase / HUMPS family protein [Staphylothermus marinus]ABN69600.1 Orotidine 5'-phosphate decarboxylase [Staphylothermus marinus F1]